MSEPLRNRAKLWLALGTGLYHATLHVHVGMIIWVAGVAVAGDVGAVWPLALVIAAELVNEVFDRVRVGSWRIADTIQDIVNSVLWPVVLFTLARAGIV